MIGEVSQEDSPQSTRSPVRVPRELIREILRILYNDSDKWTLETCALVSQEWLHESRHFLFRHIDISDSTDQDLADRFLSDILHSERLSNLHTLTWQLDNYGHPFRTEVFNAFGWFSRLHHLELVSCVFYSFEDFKKVLVTLPVLSSLTLYRAMWYDQFQTTDLSETPPPSTPSETRPALSKISVCAVHPRSLQVHKRCAALACNDADTRPPPRALHRYHPHRCSFTADRGQNRAARGAVRAILG